MDRILLISADPDERQALRKALSGAGRRVEIARDVAEALERLAVQTDGTPELTDPWSVEMLGMVRRIAPALSHEMGNSLNSVGGYLQLLRMEAEPGSDLEATVAKCEAGLSRLRVLSLALLQLLRPPTARAAEIGMSPIIEEALALAQPTFLRLNVTIDRELPSLLPEIRARRDQLLFLLLGCLLEVAGPSTEPRRLLLRGEGPGIALACEPEPGGIAAALEWMERLLPEEWPLKVEQREAKLVIRPG